MKTIFEVKLMENDGHGGPKYRTVTRTYPPNNPKAQMAVAEDDDLESLFKRTGTLIKENIEQT